MTEVQKNCGKLRRAIKGNSALNSEPTLWAFTIRKPLNVNDTNNDDDGTENNRAIKSNRFEQHYFCADNDQYLEGWKKCIIEQIHTDDAAEKRHSRQQSIALRGHLTNIRKRSQNGSDSLREATLANMTPTPARLQSNASNFEGYSTKRHNTSFDYVDTEKKQDLDSVSDGEINEKMHELMDALKIPKNARPKMLLLDKKQKIKMLQQHALKQSTKQRQSGRRWSEKFASYKQTNISTLQQFCVVLRDEEDNFVKDFIENLGLNHLCRLGLKESSSQRGKSYSTGFDAELLRVMKAIIDTNENSIKALVEHDHSIRIIVEKIDSEDIKISQLALSLLVTLVGIQNDEISITASNKILIALKDLALSKGQRNKYKVLISHISVKDVLHGSFHYDTYCVTLINYLIMALDKIHQRMDERRMLNSLQFEKILNKLEDRIRRNNLHSNIRDALLNQIETYRKLYEDDKRTANSRKPRASQIGPDGEQSVDMDNDWEMMDGDFDIDNPMDLFKKVHDQALKDGYINELTSILKNLVVLPTNAEKVWYNVSKIVNTACKPTFNQMINEYNDKMVTDDNDIIHADHNRNRNESQQAYNSVVGGMINIDGLNENYVKGINIDTQYPTYEQLHRMLEIREAQNNDEGSEFNISDRKVHQLENDLNEAREKQLKLENALVEEKQKYLSLETQLQHFYRYGTGNSNSNGNGNLSSPASPSGLQMNQFIQVPLTQQSSNESTNSYIVIEEEKDDKKENKNNTTENDIVKIKEDKPDPKAAMLAMIAAKTGGSTAKPTNDAPKAVADDGLNKYRKMMKFKMPKASIINRMRQDGIDKDIIEQYEEEDTLPGGNSIASSSTQSNGATAAKSNDPKAAMMAMIAAKSGGGKKANGKIGADDEQKLAKYKRMQKMHIPKQSVINRMRQDQVEPRLIGLLFPDAPEGKTGASSGGKPNIADMIRKKKGKEKPKLPENLKPKKVIKPNSKMRNLHWTTVNPFDVDKTIWNGIDDDKIKLDIKDLESKFCWKVIESKNKDTTPKEKPKNDTVRVLDPKRAYNIEIFLCRLKMDPWTLREALLSLNENKLPLDTVHKLINFVPTTEEASALDGYENEKNLGVAENFVKIIRTVDNNLVERLTLWEFKIEFEELYKAEKDSLIWLRKGHDCIKKSNSLKLVFTLILSIGNYMNGSTSKGCAYGFKLASLNQLMRSRTVDNSSTLMEYLYEFVSNPKNDTYKEAMSFPKDLQALDDATTVDISVLRQNISQIRMKLARIKKRIDNFNDKQLITRMGDNFYNTMKPFYMEAIERFAALEKLRDEIFKDLKELGIWLNEPKDSNFKYLKTMNEFRQNFLKSIKLHQQKKAKLAEIEKRKKWKEKSEKRKRKKRSSKKMKIKSINENLAVPLNDDEKDEEEQKDKDNKRNKSIDLSDKNNKDEEEHKLFLENQESIKVRKRRGNDGTNSNHNLGNLRGNYQHNSRDQNVSDVVLQTLVAGSSRNFIQRLKNRAKNNYRKNNI